VLEAQLPDDGVQEQNRPAEARKPIWSELCSVPHRLHWVDAGGYDTRVLEAGSGPPIILMHGTGGHLEAYAYNIAALSERFHVIAYDFPGHGFTTHAHDDLEIGAYVDHLASLLDALGLDIVHLNGESLGGWVAVKFAAAHPERVASLVLNTPGGTMARPEVMQQIRELSQAAADDPSPSRIRTRLEWLMADTSSVTDELVDVRRSIYSRDGFSGSMRHILCLQDPVVRERNRITDEELAGIEAPSLVIWTSDDPSGPAAAGLHMADAIQNAQFHVIDRAGHWPQWEQTAVFDRLVLEFTGGHAGEASRVASS
jgi:2-hydroxy-6-oxonona-2,4-dienedioate hydrolase